MTWLFSIGLHNAAIAMLLALLAWGVTRICKKPPVAHLLWLLVLVKLVTPPIVILPLWNWSPGSDAAANEQTADLSVRAPQSHVDGSLIPIPQSPEVVGSDASSSPAPHDTANAVADNDLHSRPPSETAHPAQPRDTLATAWFAVRPALMVIWAGGTGLIALLAGMRIVRFQRLLAGTLPAEQRHQLVADELATRLGLRSSPDVRMAASTIAPLVWCLGARAMVVIPRSLLTALDEQQTAMVLAHELAHLRRRDHWVRILELVVSVLYWWNPLVWWVRRQLHAAEEQCCDAWVAWTYPDRSHDYAQSLLKAAELLSSQLPLAGLASPFLNAQTLKSRIEVVLRNRSQRTASRRAALGLVLLAAAVIPVGVWGAARERGVKDEGQTEATSLNEAIKVVVAPVAEPKEQADKPAGAGAKTKAAHIQKAVVEKPFAKELQPFQGPWNFETYGSLKWPAKPEEEKAWQWTIHGQEITWTRPGRETLKLSFAVDPGFRREPNMSPNNIELTFLDGPDKGEKCLGTFYWFADTDILWICFQDPGAKAERPTNMGFNGYDKHTMIALQPAPPASGSIDQGKQPTTGPRKAGAGRVPLVASEKPLANELQVFQGTWSFGLCDSEFWNEELAMIQKKWMWKVQGQTITWVRWGKGIDKLSFTVDPSKTPNEIDFTFLDGRDKGKTCLGIYEFERDIIHVCMTEPGAKVARPTRMAFTGGIHTALLVLEKKPTVVAAKTEATKEAEATKPDAAPAAHTPNAAAVKPVATKHSLHQGTYNFDNFHSEKWPAEPEEIQTWQWTIQGQEIIWTRPKQETVRLSYTVDPTASPRQIDLTFLNGSDKGEKCQGIYFLSRHELVICFQDPGAKVGRPTNSGSKPGSQHSAIKLVPAEIPPVADEIKALQGVWKFEIYYSDWWPERISNPPISWSNWRWTVKGNEIRWTGMKVPDVTLSFTVDPSKWPRQIDMTFLDGPHKGKTLRGMYKFYAEDGCDICFANPDANVVRPTHNSYSTNSGRTMVAIEKLAPEQAAAEAPSAKANGEGRGPEIDAAIARLRRLGAFVREFHPRGDPQYWVQIISTGIGTTTRQSAPNFDNAALDDVEIIGRGVAVQLHLRRTSVTTAGLKRLESAGRIELLELTGPNVDNAMLKVLPKLPLRGQLGLGSDLLTNTGIEPVSECRQLTGISLEGNLLTDACLEQLTGLPKLQGVSLGKSFTRAAFEILGRVENLTNLDVSEMKPTLRDLQQVPKLRTLSLRGNEYNDETARTIADTFHSLEEAYLRDTSITNAGVQHLSRLGTVKILTLDGSLIDDGVADSIRKMKQLKWLSVGDCKVGDDTLAAVSECLDLWYLFLVNTPVTDKGLAHLVKLKKPLNLYLAHCKFVTDASIMSLAQLPDSENLHINLQNSGITEQGARQLQAALPHAQISWGIPPVQLKK